MATSTVQGTHLLVAFFCELDSVIRDHLVDLAVLISFRLCMADEDYETRFAHGFCVVSQFFALWRL